MKYICLLLVLSSQTLAQFTHIEMTQTHCQSNQCYSSPAVSETGSVFYIDTQNGISNENGTALVKLDNGISSTLISNQNEFISDVKIDTNGQPVVKIGNQIVRYPNTPIAEAITFENNGPAADNMNWRGDVSNLNYYQSVSTCDDGITQGHQILNSSIYTRTPFFKSGMINHRIIADSCSASPEPFTANNFIRVSDNERHKIYAVYIGTSPNLSSRLYKSLTAQTDWVIGDDVNIAEINDLGVAVWATELNNQVSIYIRSSDEFSPPAVLLEQILVPTGFNYNIMDLGFNNSGDIGFLLRKYHISSQTFSYELQVKKFSSNSFEIMLETGQSINNKMIDQIRWQHHGMNDMGVLTSSIRYTDGSEAILQSLTRTAQHIGFDVDNALSESQGIYFLGNVSIHQRFKQPAIITDVPVDQDYEVTNSFMRTEDEYFEQGLSELNRGLFKTNAFSVSPPNLEIDEMTVYHQITQTNPNIAISPAQTISIKYLEPSVVCNGGCLVNCFSNIDSGLTSSLNGAIDLVNTYQRLRTEQLGLTVTGNYYLNMYDQNFPAIRDAMFAEPLSFGLFYNLFQSWQPAVENLLDDDGSYEITTEMSEKLNSTLDLIEQVSNPDLKTLINRSRNQINLYELSGKTIKDFMENDFEESFVDSIFSDGFE